MANDPKDPRFRTFRNAALGVYLVFAVVFSCLIIFSVFKSVMTMSPPNAVASGQQWEELVCLEEGRRFVDELEVARAQLAKFPSRDAAERFMRFRLEWLAKVRASEGHCALSERPRLRPVFSELERLLDLYTTQAVQFDGEVGPELDALKTRLDSP